MIPLSREPGQSIPVDTHAPDKDWMRQLADAITSTAVLLDHLQLDQTGIDYDPAFPLRVPQAFAARMRPGDPNDPLLRQVLPLLTERIATAGYSEDPLAEASATRAPGLIHKYAHRALLIAAPACAVHCRYCFRRHFPYDAHALGTTFPGLAALENDPTITEVILSGGDPLMLKDATFTRLIERLDGVTHLRRLRIHTRLPVVIPARVTPALQAALASTRLATCVVLHINHKNEIGGDLPRALADLRATGAMLLNQSVLLAGVNDDLDALADLCEALFEQHVLPYYLHMPDRVQGTAHFDVPLARALRLMDGLARRLPGYLVPRLAREEPGAAYKTVLSTT